MRLPLVRPIGLSVPRMGWLVSGAAAYGHQSTPPEPRTPRIKESAILRHGAGAHTPMTTVHARRCCQGNSILSAGGPHLRSVPYELRAAASMPDLARRL